NPMIVLDDANQDRAIKGALWGALGTTGQRCTATSRIIIEKGVYREFLRHLVERARKLRVGNGLDEITDVGPAINQRQLETDLEYIEVGKAEGAKLECGGHRLEEGGYEHRWVVVPPPFAEAQPTPPHRSKA